MDIASTLTPNSQQVNAEDLIAGPRTVTITAVDGGTQEQPVFISTAEFEGRTYRPGKSMRRVLAAMWGTESANYVGRRLTIYNDPSIRFGKELTGGIRISHASHIAKPVTVSLTVTRGKRAPFTVEPLPDAPKPATGERVTKAVNAIHKTTTADELANVRRRIPADLANEPAIVQALEDQVNKTAPNHMNGDER